MATRTTWTWTAPAMVWAWIPARRAPPPARTPRRLAAPAPTGT